MKNLFIKTLLAGGLMSAGLAQAQVTCEKTCPANKAVLYKSGNGINVLYCKTGPWKEIFHERYNGEEASAIDLANYYFAKQKGLPICVSKSGEYQLSITPVE